MKEKVFYILFFIISVIILEAVTLSIIFIHGPNANVLIPIVLTFILVFIISAIKKKKEIYSFMRYILLFILSVTIFWVLIISILHKDGPNYIVFIPILLICSLVFIISIIKKKEEIYYFMLYMLLFYIISIIIGILLIISIAIFIKSSKLLVGMLYLFVLEMCFFVPYIYSIIVKRYKLSLQPENTLLKTDVKRSNKFMLIFTVLTCCFNMFISFYGN